MNISLLLDWQKLFTGLRVKVMPCLVEVSLLRAGGTISMSTCFIFLSDGSLYVVLGAFKLCMHEFAETYSSAHQERYFLGSTTSWKAISLNGMDPKKIIHSVSLRGLYTLHVWYRPLHTCNWKWPCQRYFWTYPWAVQFAKIPCHCRLCNTYYMVFFWFFFLAIRLRHFLNFANQTIISDFMALFLQKSWIWIY